MKEYFFGMSEINGVNVDEFLQSYLNTALWSSNDESTPEGGYPLDTSYTLDDYHPESLQRAREECCIFLYQMGNVIADEGDLGHKAGHDFWLTRCGHGAGFWDGDWQAGDKLTAICRDFGNVDLIVGDDGNIHMM